MNNKKIKKSMGPAPPNKKNKKIGDKIALEYTVLLHFSKSGIINY
jgi:hypothetical protein